MAGSTSFLITQKTTVHLTFKDAGGVLTAAVPAAAPTYQLMDQFNNAPLDTGVITLTPATDGLSAALVAKADGLQLVRVTLPAEGISDVFTVTITGSTGPNPIASIAFGFDDPSAQ